MTYVRDTLLPVTEANADVTWEKQYKNVPSNAPCHLWHAEGRPYVELNDDGTLYVSTGTSSRGTTVGLPQDLVRDIAQTALALEPDQPQMFEGGDCEAPFVLGVDTDAQAIAPALAAAMTEQLQTLDNETLLDLCSDGGYLGRAAYLTYKDRL